MSKVHSAQVSSGTLLSVKRQTMCPAQARRERGLVSGGEVALFRDADKYATKKMKNRMHEKWTSNRKMTGKMLFNNFSLSNRRAFSVAWRPKVCGSCANCYWQWVACATPRLPASFGRGASAVFTLGWCSCRTVHWNYNWRRAAATSTDRAAAAAITMTCSARLNHFPLDGALRSAQLRSAPLRSARF